MARQAQAENRMKVTISLSPLMEAKLSELAAANKRPQAVEAKAAVEFYLQNIEVLKNAEWQSPVEKRLEKMENRLAGLMAKLVRVAAQALYFSTLPYTKGGLPTKPLPDKAFQVLWDQSRAFAANWLKKARMDEEQAGATKVITSNEPEKK